MSETTYNPWKSSLRTGLLAGAVVLLLALVGVVATFGERFIISGLFTMGQVLLVAPILVFGYSIANQADNQTPGIVLLSGLLTGLIAGLMLSFVVYIGQLINIRAVFINASPELYGIMTFQQGYPLGYFIPTFYGLLMGAAGAGLALLPGRLRNTVTQAIIWVTLIGLLRDLIVTVMTGWGEVARLFRWMFASSGLTPQAALFLFLLVGLLSYWRAGAKDPARIVRQAPSRSWTRWATIGVLTAILLILPRVLGIFFSEILDNVGLYILMGLGLNLVVGFAGLLDLGYVAFYAIGAYTLGVLTTPELAGYQLSFWQALPFALLTSTLAGLLLGMPVLKMRGDYLAIVTLGFGEIIRIVVLSDWLRPYLGGTQGIQRIAKAQIGPITFDSQAKIYYIILAGCLIAAFITWRLKDSRLGRAWMAIREDEDVAEAMGINLVATKLLAFASGAFFAGMGGVLFASKVGSAYPHSFNLLVSINVLSLIIIGGMGSIPGVVVGSLALVGLPDLLREFAEYRIWVYGAILVAMMLVRPEGLWPEERRKLELHEHEEEAGAVAEDETATALSSTD